MDRAHSSTGASGFGPKHSYHSVGRTPLGNQGQTGSNGDRTSQPRAEFRGNRRRKPIRPYAPSHSGFDDSLEGTRLGSAGHILRRCKREPFPLDKPRSEIVTPADAHTVRQRNVPIIFRKQLATVNRRPVVDKVWKTLFPTTLWNSPRAEHRPNTGCIQTRFWTDAQVKVWGEFANYYGIRYSGKTEYQFPRGLLGVLSYGEYYSSSIPWPDPRKGAIPPHSFPRAKSKRSEFARIKRSLLRGSKCLVVKPLDFTQLLVPKRRESRSTLYLEWISRREGTFREYLDAQPRVLALNFRGIYTETPEIVKESLKRIAKSAVKMFPDRTWIGSTNLSYSMSAPRPLPRERVKLFREKCGRLSVTFSPDGYIYATRAKVDNYQTIHDRWPDSHLAKLPPRAKVLEMGDAARAHLDSLSDEDDLPTTLGSWI